MSRRSNRLVLLDSELQNTGYKYFYNYELTNVTYYPLTRRGDGNTDRRQ